MALELKLNKPETVYRVAEMIIDNYEQRPTDYKLLQLQAGTDRGIVSTCMVTTTEPGLFDRHTYFEVEALVSGRLDGVYDHFLIKPVISKPDEIEAAILRLIENNPNVL